MLQFKQALEAKLFFPLGWAQPSRGVQEMELMQLVRQSPTRIQLAERRQLISIKMATWMYLQCPITIYMYHLETVMERFKLQPAISITPMEIQLPWVML